MKVKVNGEAYRSLVGLTDESTFEVRQISTEPDTRQRAHGVGYEAVLKAVTKYTSMANLIQTLHFFASYDTHIKVDMLNGTKFYSEDISATTGFFGCKWRLISDGSHSRERRCEFEFSRRLTSAELALAIAGTTADGSPSGGDILANWGSLAHSHITPGRIERFDFKETSSVTWDDVVRNLTEGTFTAELMGGEPDELGRFRGTAIRIDASIKYMQSGSAQLAFLDDYNTRENDYRISFPDCYVTLDDRLGVHLGWSVPGSLGQNSFITVGGGGMILPSAWSGLWTAGAP